MSLLFLFSLTTPLCMLLGVTIAQFLSPTVLGIVAPSLMALGAGSFLYVAVHSIQDQFESGEDEDLKNWKLAAILGGFFAMSLVAFFD